jgi:hypothetical protein
MKVQAFTLTPLATPTNTKREKRLQRVLPTEESPQMDPLRYFALQCGGAVQRSPMQIGVRS